MTGRERLVKIGARLPQHAHRPDEVDLFLFSAASGLSHRIHFDQQYARSEGHRDLVVQGPLQGAYLATLANEWAASVGGRIIRLTYRHSAPLYVCEEVTCEGTVESVKERGVDGEILVTCEVWVQRATDQSRITIGTAVIACPSEGVACDAGTRSGVPPHAS